jgi:hypothetical protein
MAILLFNKILEGNCALPLYVGFTISLIWVDSHTRIKVAVASFTPGKHSYNCIRFVTDSQSTKQNEGDIFEASIAFSSLPISLI